MRPWGAQGSYGDKSPKGWQPQQHVKRANKFFKVCSFGPNFCSHVLDKEKIGSKIDIVHKDVYHRVINDSLGRPSPLVLKNYPPLQRCWSTELIFCFPTMWHIPRPWACLQYSPRTSWVWTCHWHLLKKDLFCTWDARWWSFILMLLKWFFLGGWVCSHPVPLHVHSLFFNLVLLGQNLFPYSPGWCVALLV